MTPSEQWEVVATGSTLYPDYEIRDQEGSVMATVYARTDGQTAKVARLLASAPDMLIALRKIERATGTEASEYSALGRIREIARGAITAGGAAPNTLAEVAEQYHQRVHRYAEVDWRDCPQDPCPERYRIVRPEQEADRLGSKTCLYCEHDYHPPGEQCMRMSNMTDKPQPGDCPCLAGGA